MIMSFLLLPPVYVPLAPVRNFTPVEIRHLIAGHRLIPYSSFWRASRSHRWMLLLPPLCSLRYTKQFPSVYVLSRWHTPRPRKKRSPRRIHMYSITDVQPGDPLNPARLPPIRPGSHPSLGRPLARSLVHRERSGVISLPGDRWMLRSPLWRVMNEDFQEIRLKACRWGFERYIFVVIWKELSLWLWNF